jgi:hypothetical protein
VEKLACILFKTRHLIPQVKSIDLAPGAPRNAPLRVAHPAFSHAGRSPWNRRTGHSLYVASRQRQPAINNHHAASVPLSAPSSSSSFRFTSRPPP